MDDVVQTVASSLRLSGRRRTAIERELRTHLEEAQRDLELSGLGIEEAAEEAQRRLGDPVEIADGFSRVHRTPRRVQLVLAFGLASALGLGAFGVSGSLASARPVTHVHAAPAHLAKHHARHPSVSR